MAWVFDEYATDRSLYAVQTMREVRGVDFGSTRNRCRRGSGSAARPSCPGGERAGECNAVRFGCSLRFMPTHCPI